MSRAAERACTRNADDLMARANVVSVAPVQDESGEKLVVLVTEKKPLSALAAEDVVPTEVEGFRTDVVQSGRIVAKLAPGTSIGLKGRGTGTAGAVVNSNGPCLLTNNHVAADSNNARALTPIHSPGSADGLGPRVGRLGRFEPIWPDRPNYVDAALVRLDGAAKRTHPRYTLTGRPGWFVRKTGRTSGTTTGRILSVGAVVDVSFGFWSARFYDQIMTDYMLAAGDSGSLLVSRKGFAVGLGFAGSDEFSFHNPISAVIRTLGITF